MLCGKPTNIHVVISVFSCYWHGRELFFVSVDAILVVFACNLRLIVFVEAGLIFMFSRTFAFDDIILAIFWINGLNSFVRGIHGGFKLKSYLCTFQDLVALYHGPLFKKTWFCSLLR